LSEATARGKRWEVGVGGGSYMGSEKEERTCENAKMAWERVTG
jgi:hypothetical protein